MATRIHAHSHRRAHSIEIYLVFNRRDMANKASIYGVMFTRASARMNGARSGGNGINWRTYIIYCQCALFLFQFRKPPGAIGRVNCHTSDAPFRVGCTRILIKLIRRARTYPMRMFFYIKSGMQARMSRHRSIRLGRCEVNKYYTLQLHVLT